MIKSLSIFLFLTISIEIYSQQSNIKLTFTAIDSAGYFQLDSIKVTNLTQESDTILYYPDTVLLLQNHSGTDDFYSKNDALKVYQNYPNPVIDETVITVYIPVKDKVTTMIFDIMGNQVINTEQRLNQGYHLFRFIPGTGNIFFFTVRCNNQVSGIKILNLSKVKSESSLNYIGSDDIITPLKMTKYVPGFDYNSGDQFLYSGYGNEFETSVMDIPLTDETYTFRFINQNPCLETPIVNFEGEVYNTVQILNQCWLKENLNVGIMINGANDMTDNGIIEKYCIKNTEDSCAKYGGLYQWNEMMQYFNNKGNQGICPPGWHIPSEEEWLVLEGAADSHYDIGDPEWNILGMRGFDSGFNLKSARYWRFEGNGNDLYCFTALPGGARKVGLNPFYAYTFAGLWWTSSEAISYASWCHGISFDYTGSERAVTNKSNGFSVRCIRDH